jgi:hypothetical protein
MVDVQTNSIIFAGLSIAVSIAYYASVLNNATKTRQTQMLMELYSAYRDPEFAKAWGEIMDQEYTDFDDYWHKYGNETNREAWNKWQSVARWFNGIGVLLKKGMVDIDLVEELLAVLIFVSWSKMSPVLYGFREWTKGQENTIYNREKYQSLSGFEYLYNELEKRNTA